MAENVNTLPDGLIKALLDYDPVGDLEYAVARRALSLNWESYLRIADDGELQLFARPEVYNSSGDRLGDSDNSWLMLTADLESAILQMDEHEAAHVCRKLRLIAAKIDRGIRHGVHCLPKEFQHDRD